MINTVYEEFCDRLKHDPVMAAACLAYVDRRIGTCFTGKYYYEIKENWIEEINKLADNFINDENLWDQKIGELKNLLNGLIKFIVDGIK